MSRVRAGGKARILNINIYFLMGFRDGARGLSSHLEKSSIFKMNLIETPSPVCPPHWNLSSFSPDSGEEADLPHLPSIIPKQLSTPRSEPAAQKAHVLYSHTE